MNGYSLLLKRTNPEEFNKFLELMFPSDEDLDYFNK